MNTRDELNDLVASMTTPQVAAVYRMARAISTPPLRFSIDPSSDVVNESFADWMGLKLVMHHTVSAEAFTKDKFEHAMVNTLTEMGRAASLAPRGNRGHDITVDGKRWSLKTQADAGIKATFVHISKFMELGKGRWEQESDLAGLRDQMLKHMDGYDRIFTLRCLSAARANADKRAYQYELLEIPKALLELAQKGEFEMQLASEQNPKPGYCRGPRRRRRTPLRTLLRRWDRAKITGAQTQNRRLRGPLLLVVQDGG